ncbi:MAG: YdbL family protein [Hahellaceae bacterium]|nr:YdbL family protein [Hahellaceae bacterium]MCP5169751.1 YdbL family protein [Hahellaceae bacterium]
MEKCFRAITRCLLVFTLFFALPSYALTLDEAKAAGLVGEQADGYLGAVKPSNEVFELVQDINRKRMDYYRGIAVKNNLDLDKVAKMAGEKLVEKAGPEDMIKINGGWKKKGQ